MNKELPLLHYITIDIISWNKRIKVPSNRLNYYIKKLKNKNLTFSYPQTGNENYKITIHSKDELNNFNQREKNRYNQIINEQSK